MDEAWIAELKAGDKVIFSGVSVVGDYVAVVTKVTPARIFVGTRRFKKDGSESTKDRWGRVWLKEATLERVLAIKQETIKSQMASVLGQINWHRRTFEQVKEAYDTLHRPQTGEPWNPEDWKGEVAE